MPIVLAAEEVWAPEVSQEDIVIFVMKNLESILFSDVHHTVVHLLDCSNYMEVDFQMHFQLIHLLKIIL